MLYMVIAAKNFRRGSEGAAEGGCGGNSAMPERIELSPRHLPEYLEGGTEQKNILFLFRRKNRSRAKSEMWRMFFCEVATGALAEAGGGAGHRPSKKVRAKDIISPPSCTFSEIARSCLGAKRLGMVFFRLRK